MREQRSLDSVLSAVVQSDELQGVLVEYIEIGIDAFIKDGIGREIPIAGSLMALVRVGGAVRDRIFTMKLLAFLGPLGDVPATERRELVSRLEEDNDYGRRVGEHLLGLLDRIEEHRKPEMLARIFLAYLRREVDAIMLHRLTHAVERLPAFEIPVLRKMYGQDPRSTHPASLANLVAAGLLDTGLSSPIGGGRITHRYSAVGEAFIKLELDLPVVPKTMST